MAASPKLLKIPFYKLVVSGVDLASTFKSAVDAYNARDLANLLNLCDDNVVVVGFKRQDCHCGKQEASVFLADQFRLNKPSFTPTSSNTTINPTGTVAHITGAADWIYFDPDDPRGTNTDCSVRYAFNFVNRGNGWLISTVWGSFEDYEPSTNVSGNALHRLGGESR